MKEEELKDEKRYSKYLGRRWLLVCWTCLLISLIVVMETIFKTNNFSGLAMTLSAVPISFVSIESWNKKYRYNGGENENGDLKQ